VIGRLASFAAASILVALTFAGAAHAAVGSLYDVKATWGNTNLTPGDAKANTTEGQFSLLVRNIGDAVGTDDLIIEDILPEGVIATAIHWPSIAIPSDACSGTTTVKCTLDAALLPTVAPPPGDKRTASFAAEPSGYLPTIFIDVSVANKAFGEGTNVATVRGGGAPAPVSDIDQVPFSKERSHFGLVPGSYLADMFAEAYPFGEPARQASDHPFEFRFAFDLTEKAGVNDGPGGDGTRYMAPNGALRTAEVTLPRGIIGNPEAIPKCGLADFAEQGSVPNSTACPSNTQLGYLNVSFNDGTRNFGAGLASKFDWGLLSRVPLYNFEPPKGTPVDLGFNAGGLVQAHIYATLNPAHNYAITAVTPNISSLVQVRGSEVTLWGVPGDPAHDRFRYYPREQKDGDVLGASFGGTSIRPFFTNPMDCGFDNGGALFSADSYEHPGEFTPVAEHGRPLNVSGCNDPRFRFEPDISLQPTDRHASAPMGLDVHLRVPQRNDEVEDANELYAANNRVRAIATPPIKKAVVRLPEGMTLNPSAAQGLGSCSLEQIGLETSRPVTCPDSSQYGTVILHTPILPVDAQPEGHVYIAKQGENPSNNFLSLYLVIQEPEKGILVKLAGRADLDPVTGQITVTFDDLPQLPVSDMQMNLKGGVRAGLVSPQTCGRKTITASFYSWQDPQTPHTVKSSYEITEKPDGSPCVANLADRPFKPTLEAGTTNNLAGSYSPFVLRLTRTDDDQEFSQIGVTLPPGLAARFAHVGACSDAGIAQAESRSGAGQGALEQADPSCPASSLIGTTEVGAGVGVPLTFVPGKVYLAGPYKGAPISMVAISPAVVGPFDLGAIAVRTALRVDPLTAQGTAFSDPLPQIFQGIPVRIRDLRLNLDRPGFTLNPTSCTEKQIHAHITGTGGDVASTADDTAAELSNRFQAADCAGLGFQPKLNFRLRGGTHRSDHPKLTAVLTYPKRGTYANIASASVALPHSEFLDQAHIKTICTRVQFAVKACPAGSIYGFAKAKTPLFDFPLEGPVYLRSSSNPLPDLVAALHGPASLPIEIELTGRVDSANGGLRTTFDQVPDAPVSEFSLEMQGGKKGLIVNSTNLCLKANRATAKFSGQNGKLSTLRPALETSCKKARKHKPQRRAR
jgi:hypothetical protein